MTQAPMLTGQDIAEAEGAVTRLLEQALAREGITRLEYLALRVLALRGPWASPRELHAFLAGQRQLGLTETAAAELLAGLEDQGLASGTAAGAPARPRRLQKEPRCTPALRRRSPRRRANCSPALTLTTWRLHTAC
jgi:hypothetical protein